MITFCTFLVCALVFGGAARWLERRSDPPERPVPPAHVDPPPVDPPLTDEEQLQNASVWPHLVSAYYRESHHR